MPYHECMYFTPWGWIMMAFMALFWIVIVVGVVWLVIYLSRRAGGSSSQQSALDILNQRYARGEISKEEYDRMKKEITSP